jgi:hypothetical protein
MIISIAFRTLEKIFFSIHFKNIIDIGIIEEFNTSFSVLGIMSFLRQNLSSFINRTIPFPILTAAVAPVGRFSSDCDIGIGPLINLINAPIF